MDDLTYQQRMVFDRIEENNRIVREMNGAFRGRASFITLASTAIVGLITAARFLPANSDSSGFEFILLALVCLCSVGIYWMAALLWRGGTASLPGTSDLQLLYDAYIGKTVDEAYHNLLSDLCAAFEENMEDNNSKARLLGIIVGLFIIQLILLALSIAWASLSA